METCECPLCDMQINLAGCEENDVIDCPQCGTNLEIVSLTPPVLEEATVDDADWE